MIEIKDLTKEFQTADGTVEALRNVNLNIQNGDIYGIIGMSGAGKSTLVRCINMLERPTKGQVLIDGQDIAKLSDKELRAVRRHGGRPGVDRSFRKGAAAGPEEDQYDLPELQPADAADLPEKYLLPPGTHRHGQGESEKTCSGASGRGRPSR